MVVSVNPLTAAEKKKVYLMTGKDICEDWHLSQGLENAGVGGGAVKSYEHLKEVFVSRTSTTEES